MIIYRLTVSSRWVYEHLQKLPLDSGFIKMSETDMVAAFHISFPLLSKCLAELARYGLVRRNPDGFYFPLDRRRNHAKREEIRRAFTRSQV